MNVILLVGIVFYVLVLALYLNEDIIKNRHLFFNLLFYGKENPRGVAIPKSNSAVHFCFGLVCLAIVLFLFYVLNHDSSVGQNLYAMDAEARQRVEIIKSIMPILGGIIGFWIFYAFRSKP